MDAPEGSRELQVAMRSDMWKRKHGSLGGEEDRPSYMLPGVHNIISAVVPEHATSDAVAARPKRRLITPLSSPEPTFSNISAPDDPITRSLNRGRRPEKGLLSRPTGLGTTSMRFALPTGQSDIPHETRRSFRYSRQQPSPPRDDLKRAQMRAKSKGTHCNVKYLPEELDFIRYHKIDLKESWNEVLENFKAFQQRFPKEELDRRVQGLQGVHYRENYAIPKPRRETNGRQVCFLPNGHVLAHGCKVREQSEFKFMYGLVHLFPERAKDYTWVRADHRHLAAELNIERIQAMAQEKRAAMERGLWVEKLEDNSCMCCEREDRDLPPQAMRNGQVFEYDYVDGSSYDPRL